MIDLKLRGLSNSRTFLVRTFLVAPVLIQLKKKLNYPWTGPDHWRMLGTERPSSVFGRKSKYWRQTGRPEPLAIAFTASISCRWGKTDLHGKDRVLRLKRLTSIFSSIKLNEAVMVIGRCWSMCAGSEDHRFKTQCQQGLFNAESPLKSTLPFAIWIHNIISCVGCIGWLYNSYSGPRGDGIMDSVLACGAGEPGSIPALSKWFFSRV